MAKKRILVVEDEKILLDLYASVLLRQGRADHFDVDKAESAEEALRAASGDRFDLILTDYHLPGADGISLIRRVKALNPSTAFILISGYLSPDIQRSALEAGAVTCLKKPCSIQAIVSTIENTLSSPAVTGRRPGAAPAGPAAEAAPLTPPPPPDEPPASEQPDNEIRRDRLRRRLEDIPHAALFIDRERNARLVNARFSREFAPPAEGAAGRCHQLLYGAPLPCPTCPLSGVRAGEPASLDRRLRMGDAVIERIEADGEDGFVISLIARFAEEEPEAPAVERQSALDFFMLALDRSGRIVFCDDHFPPLFETPKAEILGRPITDFLYSYFRHYLAKQEKDFLQFARGCGDRPVTLDFVSGPEQERRPILCEFMLRDASFPPAWELLLVGMDMKRRLELHRLIEFERESLHRLRYGQFDMVITIDKDFRIKTINNACLNKLDARARELTDSDFTDLLARSCDRQSFAQGLAQAQALKDVFNLRLDIAFKGRTTQTLVNISAVRDSFNDEIGYVLVLRDIERQLKMEATLRHVERMQALGQLAAGTAHQINNYTNAILGSADLLGDFVSACRETLPGPAAEAADVIDIIRESTQKLTALTRHLTVFARAQQAPVISAGDVNKVVTDTLELTRTHLSKKAVNLDISLARDLPAVHFSPLHLEQAVLNIIMNAVDAVGDSGGRLAVSTFRREDWVCISVADNGPGIPPEIRASLFEAFVTTKPEGVGTGLGLNVARDVVESLKGVIQVESEPDRGTIMTIKLPVPETPAVAQP